MMVPAIAITLINVSHANNHFLRLYSPVHQTKILNETLNIIMIAHSTNKNVTIFISLIRVAIGLSSFFSVFS